MSISTASDLVETCYLIRLQVASQITAQLQQLRQHTTLQLTTIRQQERTSSAAQQIILDQLRPHLAIDARSLLPAAEFADFVQDLQSREGTTQWRLKPQLEDWLLLTLTPPLQLHNIDTRACAGAIDPCACETQLRVQVGSWQQMIIFPAVLYDEDNPDAGAAHRKQWLAMHEALTTIADQFAIAESQQEMVQQELFCLLTFVGELFNLRELANAVHTHATTVQCLA